MGLLISILLLALYTSAIKNKIRANKSFDGLVWGILVSLTTNLICAIIFYEQTSKALSSFIEAQILPQDKQQVILNNTTELKKELLTGLIIGVVLNIFLLILINLLSSALR